MKFTCPHCGKQYDRVDAYAGQKAKCKSCQKEFTISGQPQTIEHTCSRCLRSFSINTSLVGKEVCCPLCGFAEVGLASQSAENIHHYTHNMMTIRCRCGKAYRISSDQINQCLFCGCGKQIFTKGSQLYYLRSLRRIALFFFWLILIGIILTIINSI